MRVAVTGTPGTGKTSACNLLKGVTVIDLRKLAEEHAGRFSYDRSRKTLEVDPKILIKMIPKVEGTVVLDGHLSHLLKPDFAIVLRCSPEVLAKRLAKRRWSKKKIRENVEAEAVDVVLIDAMDACSEVFEIDTTEMTPLRVSKSIAEIIRGESGKYRPGNVDWSTEVLGWY